MNDRSSLKEQYRLAGLVSASIRKTAEWVEKWTLKQVQGDGLLGASRQTELRVTACWGQAGKLNSG
jgi:hypothetical protein